ncbi:F-box protein At3g07870-like [Cornus florida]|uniref:F-box protein At3g07870-like n=1 Tax=Cornus florida TaxID=4283 RepID=UPI00289FCE7B|nr:F-box protein At3g07870-like [Cornus florida]
MRRRRISTLIGNRGADNDEQTQILDCSANDLPSPIVVDILLRLPVKAILVCKCVSKTWRSLISDPHFAKMHFSRQQPCPLIRTLDSTLVSRMLYLIEPETCNNFDLGDCSCYGLSDECGHHVNMKLDTKLKIPLRNAGLVLNGEEGDAQMGCFSKGSGVKRKRCIKVKPKEQKFKIVNSCNGFLCLSEPFRNDPVVVCNPVTGEYINLPVVNRAGAEAGEKTKEFGDCGFGFSPKANQYKVIRMFQQWIADPITGSERYGSSAEINTLGTGSWRSIGDAPFSCYRLTFPTYLKGCLHWFCLNSKTSNYIASFNFDDEQFQWVPPPPRHHDVFDDSCTVSLNTVSNVSMGVLKGCLCMSDASSYCPIVIWVMKKYGVKKSWRKMFSIDTGNCERWPIDLYQPINYLKNGTLLMFQYFTSSLICYDPKRSQELKYLKLRGVKSKFEAIAHIPSFISLKEAIVGDNVVVLNINSRCAKFKVLGETKALSLAEEDRDMASDSLSSYSDTDDWKHLWQRW